MSMRNINSHMTIGPQVKKLAADNAALRAQVEELKDACRDRAPICKGCKVFAAAERKELTDRATKAEARVAELEVSLGRTIETSAQEALDRIYRNSAREQELIQRVIRAEAQVEKLERVSTLLAKELNAQNTALGYLLDALDIDQEDTRIDIKSGANVVASVSVAELRSRADAALRTYADNMATE